MSKIWTKQEEAVLTEYMGTRRVLYWRDRLAIHKLIPNRSMAAIEKRWSIMLKRTAKSCLKPDAQAQLNEQMSLLVEIKHSQDIHTIKRMLYELGFRKQVTIELGE
jgi:hypothetical protein